MAGERGGWRGDIEGLRALAIAPVLLFHLDRRYAPGGFLGVDLFLVISGYLIARMLLTGRYLDSAAGVRQFLRRRFLRIVPALATTVAVTALIFAWIALPVYHRPFFLTGLASLFGVSNLQLARLSTDYFAPAAGINPFLHTWSVSIEDQFYLAFVLLLAVAVRVGGRSRLPATIAVGAAVALEYALFNPPAPGSPGFFALHLRAWELLLGALAFVVQEGLAARVWPWPDALRLAGLLAVLVGLVRGAEGAGPYQYALCGGCAALLMRPAPMVRSRLSDALAHPVLRAIGRRSFALYLVHFPVFKLFELWTDIGADAPALGLVCLAATAGLAEVLHRGIERPYVESYRRPEGATLRHRPRSGVLWALAVASVLVALVALPRVSRARALAPRLARAEVRDYPGAGARELILLGDSHAQQLYPTLVRLVRSDSLAVVNRAVIGCMPSGELSFVRDGMVQQGCQTMVRELEGAVARQPRAGRVVLIAMRTEAYLSDRRISRFDRPVDGVADSVALYPNAGGRSVDAYMASLGRLVDHLARAGVPVLFMAPLPEMRLPVFSCFYRRERPACRVPRAEEQAYRARVMAGLRAVEATHPTFRIWDPFDAVCPRAACTHFSADTLVFSDDNHLSAEMAAALAPSLRRAITEVSAR